MHIKNIPHGFTYIYEEDARHRLRPAKFARNGLASSESDTAMFQNYDHARNFLKVHGDPRRTYFLSEVPYA